MTSLRMSFTLVAYYGFCLGGVGVLHNKTFLYKMHAISYIVTSLPLVRYAETSGPDPQHIVNNGGSENSYDFFNKKAYRPSYHGMHKRWIDRTASQLFGNATTTDLDYMV